MPSIVLVNTSPGCKEPRWLAGVADALRGAGEDEVTR